jgi:hypothetical protein
MRIKNVYMSFKVTKSKIYMIGMVIGIGLIGMLPVLHNLGLFGYSLF